MGEVGIGEVGDEWLSVKSPVDLALVIPGINTSFSFGYEDDEEDIVEPEVIEDEVKEELEEESENDIFYDNSSDEDDVEDNDDELTDFIVVDEDETSM